LVELKPSIENHRFGVPLTHLNRYDGACVQTLFWLRAGRDRDTARRRQHECELLHMMVAQINSDGA